MRNRTSDGGEPSVPEAPADGGFRRHKSIWKQQRLFLLSSGDKIWACSHDQKTPDWESSDDGDNWISVHLWDFSQSVFEQRVVRHTNDGSWCSSAKPAISKTNLEFTNQHVFDLNSQELSEVFRGHRADGPPPPRRHRPVLAGAVDPEKVPVSG